ncbi:MAG: hypothetical protein ACFFC3_16355 [Candidatus Odinarchaeota archaeon]
MTGMKVFKQKKGDEITRDSVAFFKEHYKELGEINYIVLYLAEREWELNPNNPDLSFQFVIIIGEKAQLWMSGLTWGYYGEGPYGLFEVIHTIDPSITYEYIVDLEWGLEYHPIVFQNVEGSLILVSYNNSLVPLLKLGKTPIRWDLLW